MTAAPGLGNLFSKTTAISILGGLLWLSATAIVAPLYERLNAAKAEIELERKLSGKLQSEVQRLAALPTPSFSDAKQRLLLTRGSDAAMVASLQSQIAEAGTLSGIRLTSFLPSEQVAQGPLRTIGIRAVASGSMDKLQSFLHSIESGSPALIVTGLTIAPPAQDRIATGDLDMSVSIVAGADIEERLP